MQVSKASLGLVAVACLLLCSCGKPGHEPTYSVTGRVLLDGQPAKAIVIVANCDLKPGDLRTTQGNTDENGSFFLSTFEQGDGAPNGDYALTFTKLAGLRGGDELQGRYSDPTQSPRKFKVEGKAVDLGTIELTTK